MSLLMVIIYKYAYVIKADKDTANYNHFIFPGVGEREIYG